MYSFTCQECAASHEPSSLAWRCSCGGLLDLAWDGPEISEPPMAGDWSQWRYRVIPTLSETRVSLGEGMTPLVPSARLPGVTLKCDFFMPTGSFKDRGASVLATAASQIGVTRAVLDSSGNAATAMSAYCAKAGIDLTVFVPASTSPGKLAHITAHGAELKLVPGPRSEAARAATAAANAEGVFYASHVYNPLFYHGVKTYIYEIFEQRGGSLPDTIMVPVGNGTMVLGAYLGITELMGAGLVQSVPRLVAVQAENCSPLAARFAGVEPAESNGTLAEGIAITNPPRQAEILSAIAELDGDVRTVTEAQISTAKDNLAAEGFFVEPTAAVCYAAATAAEDHGETVIPLCGSGLKSVSH